MIPIFQEKNEQEQCSDAQNDHHDRHEPPGASIPSVVPPAPVSIFVTWIGRCNGGYDDRCDHEKCNDGCKRKCSCHLFHGITFDDVQDVSGSIDNYVICLMWELTLLNMLW